jgi:DNA-binding NarL/FixJ family response regulator
MNQQRVLLADDHPLFREALRAAVSRLRPDFAVEQAQSLGDARQALLRDPKVEFVLLDLKLPDCDGLIGLVALRAEFPHAPVVVISATEDALTVSNAVAAGALGFIPKSASMATISKALKAILAGDIWTPEHLVLTTPSHAVRALASLSPAQARLLPCLGRGLSNRRIADELGVTEATVKAHMTAAFRKLGVATRTQALLLIASEVHTESSTSA